jgi:predicted GNAT family acetyltransferase
VSKIILFFITSAAVIAAATFGSAAFSATTQSPSITFNADQHLINLSLPSTGDNQSLEPGIKTDSSGDIYINAIRGVPAGADLWKTTTQDCQDAADHECPIFYMGQPETYGNTGVGPGGGDIDMDIGDPYSTTQCAGGAPLCSGSTAGNLYMASLWLGNNTAITCKDGALASSSCAVVNPSGTTSADEDREWVAHEGQHTAYMVFHTVGPNTIDVCKSTNDGLAYSGCTSALTNAALQGVADNELGNMMVDNTAAVSPSPGTCVGTCHYIYEIFLSVKDATENAVACPLHTVWMAVSKDDGVSWTDNMVYNDPRDSAGATSCNGTTALNYIFPSTALDNQGNVYAAWTDGSSVYYETSTDHGVTWDGHSDGTGPPTTVNLNYGTANCHTSPTTTCALHTSIFPWVAATGNGHLDFVWYGSSSTAFDGSTNTFGDVNSAWSVFFAESFNAAANAGSNASAPTFFQTIANQTPNKVGPMCVGGLTGCLSGGRDLGDFFQVAIEPA